MASPLISQLKSEARRALRATLPPPTMAAAESAALRPPLLVWLMASRARTIATFAPLPGEVDLLPLLAEAPALRWVLPRVDGLALNFHHVGHPSTLLAGAFGIAEPHADHPVIPVGEIDLFLCPGLGFTAQGVRMGRGKGFYDRALSQARADVLKVGITFPSQIVAELPTEPHDLRMDFLATSIGVVPCH